MSVNFAANDNKMKPQAALFHANRGQPRYLNPLGAEANLGNTNMGRFKSGNERPKNNGKSANHT